MFTLPKSCLGFFFSVICAVVVMGSPVAASAYQIDVGNSSASITRQGIWNGSSIVYDASFASVKAYSRYDGSGDMYMVSNYLDSWVPTTTPSGSLFTMSVPLVVGSSTLLYVDATHYFYLPSAVASSGSVSVSLPSSMAVTPASGATFPVSVDASLPISGSVVVDNSKSDSVLGLKLDYIYAFLVFSAVLVLAVAVCWVLYKVIDNFMTW